MTICELHFLSLGVFPSFTIHTVSGKKKIRICPCRISMHFLKDYQPNKSYSQGGDVVQLILITYRLDLFSVCSLPSYYFTGSKKKNGPI